MADSKVSGLAAVAAFATTQEFPVNDSGTSKKITGAQIVAAVAQGTLPSGYAQVVANQNGIFAAVALTGLSVTVTPVTGRRIRVSSLVRFSQNTSTGLVVLQIQEGVTSLAQAVAVLVPAGTSQMSLYVSGIFQPTPGAHTYAMVAFTSAGTVDVVASATAPAYILAEDIGV